MLCGIKMEFFFLFLTHNLFVLDQLLMSKMLGGGGGTGSSLEPVNEHGISIH